MEALLMRAIALQIVLVLDAREQFSRVPNESRTTAIDRAVHVCQLHGVNCEVNCEARPSFRLFLLSFFDLSQHEDKLRLPLLVSLECSLVKCGFYCLTFLKPWISVHCLTVAPLIIVVDAYCLADICQEFHERKIIMHYVKRSIFMQPSNALFCAR